MANGDPASNLLLVEGVDDKHVVRHLRKRLVPDLNFCCEVGGGIEGVLESIALEMRPAERTALGILVDANDDLSARWQALAERLRREGVTLPKVPSPKGTVVPGERRVGIWLMPDNQTPGELENFVVQLLPEGDPVWPFAQRFIEDIPHEHRHFKNKEMRAKLYAWLATRRKSPQMGEAIRDGALDAKAPIAIRFAAWLKVLFGP